MNSRRYGQIIVGLLLLTVGFLALFNTPQIAGVLLAIGLIVFATQYGKSAERLNSERYEAARRTRLQREPRRESPYGYDFPEREGSQPRQQAAPTRSAPADSHMRPDGVYRHALEAARRAGLDTDQTYVLPTDVGVMVFEGNQPPVIQRTAALDENADFIQPFIQLRLPTDAAGRVKFEIVNSDGERRFVYEDSVQLSSGSNFLTPAARLRVKDLQDRDGAWKLRVYAENTLIAEHEIAWNIGTASIVRRHLMEDGEISTEANSEMRAMMAQQRLESMSLDDLLAYQEEDEPPSKAAHR